MTLDAPPCLGSDHVIKTVALGVVCLAGLGAIAAAAKKSTSAPPEIIRPVVAGNKADRLSPPVNQDTGRFQPRKSKSRTSSPANRAKPIGLLQQQTKCLFQRLFQILRLVWILPLVQIRPVVSGTIRSMPRPGWKGEAPAARSRRRCAPLNFRQHKLAN